MNTKGAGFSFIELKVISGLLSISAIQLTLTQRKSTIFNFFLHPKADPATGIISFCGLVNHRTAAEELEKSLQINCANLGRVYNALSTPKCPAP